MDISKPYTKVRKNFGRQPIFCEVPVHMLDSINPNIADQKQYILRNPVNQECQASRPMSEHYVNTKQVTVKDQGINHAEGGWPKEIPFDDEELTSRLRRRIERDDSYIEAVLGSHTNFQHYIKQNNAIDMYTMYFKGMASEKPVEKNSIRINNVYKDPDNRPVSSISWTCEDDPKLVVSYCDKKYPILQVVNKNFDCFIWNLENPENPLAIISPPAACWQLTCSPVDPSLMIGGLEDGRVCIFDNRVQLQPISIIPMHLSHRDPVSSVLFVQTRLNTEFFSGSSDGRCIWWDVRNVSRPTEELIMSVRAPHGHENSLAYSEGISCLQFEKTLPTRFLCGTDTGYVININRKGKTHSEIMSAVFNAHNGQVRAVHRSPCSVKVFITCGDWSTHIWSDDIHTSPIITGTQQRYHINDVSWAPQRVSSFMTVGSDGKFRHWDLLRKQHEPIMVLSVSKTELLKIKPHEEGRLVAVGDKNGSIVLMSLSESLTVSKDNDKQLMLQTFDRETRREHVLENRVKEIRLKLKTDETTPVTTTEVVDEEAVLKLAEDEYKRIVIDELRNYAIQPGTAGVKKAMRKR